MGLTMEQLIDFQTNGYVVVENLFTDEDLAPVIQELEQLIDDRARTLYDKGEITDLYEDEPFETRFAYLQRQSSQIGNGMDIMHYRGQNMFHFLHNERLLDVAQCLLGREISCNPIQHVRAKLPALASEGPNYFQNVPWHQDAGVTLEEADPSEIYTFWIPLVDATRETGCMEVMPKAFKRGHLDHQSEGGLTIVDDQLPDIEPDLAECPKGGAVIMNKYTPHRGTTNESNIIRWSIDLRYHKTGAPSGRPFHPSFVVRSEENPDAILTDHEKWSQLWQEALQQSKGKQMHRVVK